MKTRTNFIRDAATPHVGPTAQDFHATFGLGPEKDHSVPVDADGVVPAAPEGLNQKLEQKFEQKETEMTECQTDGK